MLKALIAASAISLAAVSGAAAAGPVTPGTAAAAIGGDRAMTNVIDAQVYIQREPRRVHPRHRSQRYVPGRRYSRAPRGWHRYSSRPRDWQRRGCIVVGPVWFCP